ncbi:hypothetical protein ILP97_22075 [Amycolatopsis sp. H6(2020)]|nr:hypothetical protein [Amycolatopsis sp. H6(2020)]
MSRFPDPASLEPNRLLRRIVVDAEFRAVFVRDRRHALLSFPLTTAERAAVADTDGFPELTEPGAHPLLALSARQVSEIEQRRQAAAAEVDPGPASAEWEQAVPRRCPRGANQEARR